jgi:hypothetical protein
MEKIYTIALAHRDGTISSYIGKISDPIIREHIRLNKTRIQREKIGCNKLIHKIN